MNEYSILKFYRILLKEVRTYPSVKQHDMYLEIKESFKQNRHLSDKKLLEKERKKCHMGIMHLRMYNEKNKELLEIHTTTPQHFETINPKDENFIYF